MGWDLSCECVLQTPGGVELGPLDGVTAGSLSGSRGAAVKWSGSLTYEGGLSRTDLVRHRVKVWLVSGGVRLGKAEAALRAAARRCTPVASVTAGTGVTSSVGASFRRSGRWLLVSWWARAASNTSMQVRLYGGAGALLNRTPHDVSASVLACLGVDASLGLLPAVVAGETLTCHRALVYTSGDTGGVLSHVVVGADGQVECSKPVWEDVTPLVEAHESAAARWSRTPLGVFLMFPGEEAVEGTRKQIKVNLFDNTYLLKNDVSSSLAAVSLSQGASVAAFLARVIRSVGVNSAGVGYENIGVARTAYIPELGDSKLDVINAVLDANNYNSLQCDFDGNYYTSPYRQPKDMPIFDTIMPGAGCQVLNTFTHSMDAQVPNRIIVVRKGDSGSQDYIVVRENNDPNSPYSFVNTGVWITRVEEIQEQNTTNSAVISKADRLLAEAEGVISTEYQMRLAAVPLGSVFKLPDGGIATLENVDIDLFNPVMRVRLRWANV